MTHQSLILAATRLTLYGATRLTRAHPLRTVFEDLQTIVASRWPTSAMSVGSPMTMRTTMIIVLRGVIQRPV